jgi:hypothetical protein
MFFKGRLYKLLKFGYLWLFFIMKEKPLLIFYKDNLSLCFFLLQIV